MGAESVLVGCKMPNGVVLDLDRYAVDGHNVRLIKGKLEPVLIKGPARKMAVGDQSVDGYVFTEISKAFWDAWSKQNPASPLVADGFLVVANDHDAAKGIARDMEDRRGQFPRMTEADIMALGVQKGDKKDAA